MILVKVQKSKVEDGIVLMVSTINIVIVVKRVLTIFLKLKFIIL